MSARTCTANAAAASPSRRPRMRALIGARGCALLTVVAVAAAGAVADAPSAQGSSAAGAKRHAKKKHRRSTKRPRCTVTRHRKRSRHAHRRGRRPAKHRKAAKRCRRVRRKATQPHGLLPAFPSSGAPINLTPPTISGSPLEGQVLAGSTGTWSGNPSSYAYQWQDCDASASNCTNVGGATSATYALGYFDLGHRVRVVVTAANARGSTSAASLAGGVVSVACTSTVSPSMSAAAIANAIVSAKDGDTVCMAGGSYPSISVTGANHASYVTVQPAPGATASVNGIQVDGSSFLRIQGLSMSGGINLRDTHSRAGHDYQIIANTLGPATYGVTIDGNAAPVTNVLIDSNYFHQLDFPGSCSSGAGYAGGQGVTNYYGDGITVAHNTFKEVSWHYIQGGGEQIGMTVDHNLFEGPIPPAHAACTHLNVWQIWDGGRNDTFSNNIVRGEPGKPAAVTPLMFETGAAGAECAKSMTNTTVTNNLFVYSSTAYAVQILTTTNLTYANNTSVGSQYGVWLDRSDTCGPGANYDIQRNISVQNLGTSPDFSIGDCAGACTFDYNVSQDGSAGANGSKHSVSGWGPAFTDPVSYQPIGLPFAAGYVGGGGP